MKRTKLALFITSAVLFSLFGGIEAQNKEIEVVKATTQDERFNVVNYTFFKKHSIRGGGQELNSVFEIINNTDKTINLKVMVVAFYEGDQVNPLNRKRYGYPTWRKKDLEKEEYIIKNLDTIPVVADKSNKTEDPEKKDQKENTNDPSFSSLINMMDTDAELGENISLKGLNAKGDPVVSTDRLYVDMQPLRTTVFSKLYVPYSANLKFFTHFGVILKDVDTGKVVYSQLIHFTTPLRIH